MSAEVGSIGLLGNLKRLRQGAARPGTGSRAGLWRLNSLNREPAPVRCANSAHPLGPRVGHKLFTLQTVPPGLQGPELDPNGAAHAGGSSLHAGVNRASAE